MTAISYAQAQYYALAAGFSGNGLSIIMAIAIAESGLDPLARGVNTDGSIDRGILQINSKSHAEVSDAVAYNPSSAFVAGYRISRNGTYFGEWSTYTNGRYRQYLTQTKGTSSTSLASITQEKNPWYSYPITHGYITSSNCGDCPHYAVDLAMPVGTKFTFPFPSGTVKIADYRPWGGEVFVAVDGKSEQFYAFHLDMLFVRVGQRVQLGDILGLTGGQNSGGNHPTQSQFSNGPHLHVGWYQKYVYTGPQMGNEPYGSDFTPTLMAIRAGNPIPVNTGGIPLSLPGNVSTLAYNISSQAHTLLISHPGLDGVALALDKIEQFPGIIQEDNMIQGLIETFWYNAVAFSVRSLLVTVGLLLLAALIFNAVQPYIADAAKLGELAA